LRPSLDEQGLGLDRQDKALPHIKLQSRLLYSLIAQRESLKTAQAIWQTAGS
jgi:hypothetical protein